MVLGKQSRNYADASKVMVGEIDTSSPFESVKHAVSLYGTIAFARKRTQLSGRKLRTQSSEKLSAKESRLHLAKKELNKLKDNLCKTDLSRSLALAELEKAKKTVDELYRELSLVGKSKDVVLKQTELSNNCIGNAHEKSSSNIYDRTLSSCRRELDTFTVQYLAAAHELNEAKKELGKLRQDYNTASSSLNAALRESSEAEVATKANNEAAVELSQKISEAKKLIERVKLASKQAKEEKLRIEASSEPLRIEYKVKLSASAKTLESLKRELDPETTRDLQNQLECIYDQIRDLKQDIKKAKDSCSARMLSLELVSEKATLQKLLDEESYLRQLIESLKLQLKNMKKELLGMNMKETAEMHLVEDLEAELQRVKFELEKCMVEESKVRSNCDELKATLVNFLTETQKAKQEAKNITLETETVMNEVEADRSLIKEYEAKLQLLLQEVEAGRSAEVEGFERVKLLSESKDTGGAKVTLSNEEFNSLSVKINDSTKLADVKVYAAKVQVELVKAFQSDCQELLKGRQKELEDIKLETAKALEMAGEAEADKVKFEWELNKLRQCLLNKTIGVPISKKYYEIDMEHPLSYPNGISKSHSMSNANRKRVTLGEILKMDREGREKGRRGHTRSLSNICRGM